LLVQIKLILEHQHELSKLGPCERFFFEISGIKRYGTRLEVMLFKSSFEERLTDLEYVMAFRLFCFFAALTVVSFCVFREQKPL